MWRPLLNGSLQDALQKSDEQTVRTVLCDCLSNVGPNSVFEQLPVREIFHPPNLSSSRNSDTDY